MNCVYPRLSVPSDSYLCHLRSVWELGLCPTSSALGELPSIQFPLSCKMPVLWRRLLVILGTTYGDARSGTVRNHAELGPVWGIMPGVRFERLQNPCRKSLSHRNPYIVCNGSFCRIRFVQENRYARSFVCSPTRWSTRVEEHQSHEQRD